jgi:hypothetical protein
VELVLNLAWSILAAMGLVYWLRSEESESVAKPAQLVALAMLALILFPVISVTDDLVAAHNPAETDTSLRRQVLAYQHTVAPEIAIPPQINTGFSLAFLGRAPASEPFLPARLAPSLSVPFIRPPPAA